MSASPETNLTIWILPGYFTCDSFREVAASGSRAPAKMATFEWRDAISLTSARPEWIVNYNVYSRGKKYEPMPRFAPVTRYTVIAISSVLAG